ncbi:MAG TPA: ABC transporter substrate-binding protein [Stellaceae bacterium]
MGKIGIVVAVFMLGLLGAVTVPASAADPVFTVATGQEPDNIDVSKTRNPPIIAPSMLNIVEPLIGLAPDGSFVPSLATWTVSPDSKMVEFKLREGVRFHSGDPLTARDIVFSHQRQMMYDENYKRRMRLIDKVEAVDDRTVRFFFKQPDAIFLKSRGPMVLSQAYHDRVGEEEFTKHPNGTGPYRFVSYRPAESLDMAAFDGYWGGAPSIKKARFVFVKDDETRVAKLRAGEVDIIMSTPFSAVDELRAAGFHTASVAVHPTVSLFFDTLNKKAPWGDVRVREALAHAVDADAIVSGLFHGIPKRFPALAPGEVGYAPDLPFYKYDPALAKKLLAEAGRGGGFSMPLYYMTSSYYGLRETAEAVSLYFKAVGVEAQVKGFDAPRLIGMIRAAHKDPNLEFAAVFPHYISVTPEPTEVLSLSFYSSSGYTLYYNPEIDKLFEQASVTIDDTKRAVFIRDAFRILHKDVPFAPLWTNVSVYTMKPTVAFTPVARGFLLMQLKDVHRQ